MKKEEFIGKKVVLFPGDTHYKHATILDISDIGYVFRITECHPNGDYKVGDIIFRNHASNVVFKLLN